MHLAWCARVAVFTSLLPSCCLTKIQKRSPRYRRLFHTPLCQLKFRAIFEFAQRRQLIVRPRHPWPYEIRSASLRSREWTFIRRGPLAERFFVETSSAAVRFCGRTSLRHLRAPDEAVARGPNMSPKLTRGNGVQSGDRTGT